MIKRNFQKLYQNEIDPWHTKNASGLIYDKVLIKIKQNIKQNIQNALDLGCGNGAFTSRLLEISQKVTGIDISSEAIKYAQEHYPSINFIARDITSLEKIGLPVQDFDLITILDVLYYFSISDMRMILENIWNLLTDDGILVLRHWSPGGGYLTHSEWQKLIQERFNIIKVEFLETKHSLLVCKKKFTNIILTIDYETWQPIPKGKSIDWEKDILESTDKLLGLADRYNVKLSFFVEMGEYYWCKKNLPQIAFKMEDQWREIIKRGHDVQIHLHPSWLPELGARYDVKTNTWFWDEHYQRIHEISINQEELLKRCKNDLERILKPVNPNYQAIVFRAGKYQIQPNKNIFEIFNKIGILADSSVWKSGYSQEHQFDFRNAYSGFQPYFASKYNINYLAPWGESDILEVPILSNGKEKWTLDNSTFKKWRKFISPYIFSKKYSFIFSKKYSFIFPKKYSFLRFNFSPYQPNPFHNKFLNNIYNFYLKVLNRIERFVNRNKLMLPNSDIVLTAIGHTKQNINLKELEKLFEFLSQYEFVQFKTISAIVKTYQEKIKSIHDRTYYENHLQSQIEYDCPAILGEKRNWQQSFYAQDKIPLDRKYILDLGCGTGYWTKRLNDIIGQTIGIDMSEDFINKAREKYPEIEFKKMDFHHLEFSDNSFDCVYADNVLEHSPYPQKVLSEIYRVLFNKGFFIALIPPDARNPQFSGFDHTWKTDKDEIEIRLQEIGFSNIQIEDINIVKKFKMSPYKASKNSMLFIIAWKWKGGYEAKERCKDIMNFVYNKLSPEQSQISNNPLKVLRGGYAWCAGYVLVMQYLCQKEGFKTKHWTLYVKNHPRGRGLRKIDTHEILEVLIDDKWIVFDPTVNRCLDYDMKTLLKEPEIVDKVLLNYKLDKRWIERSYSLYCSSWFYKNVTEYTIHHV